MNAYAKQGLRVLVAAKRYLTQTLYNDWARRLEEAEFANETRERRIRELYSEIENDFILLGN